MGCRPLDSSVRGILQDSGVGCHALLQGIFLTQGSNWSFLLCRQILYHSRSLGNSCCHEHKYTDAFFNPQYFLRRKIFHISGEFQVTHVLYIKLAFWIQPVWLTDNNSSCSFDGKTPSFISWVSYNTWRSVLISSLRMQYQFPHNLVLSKNVFCWVYIVAIHNDPKEILFLTLWDHLQKGEQEIFQKTSIVSTSLGQEKSAF